MCVLAQRKEETELLLCTDLQVSTEWWKQVKKAPSILHLRSGNWSSIHTRKNHLFSAGILKIKSLL